MNKFSKLNRLKLESYLNSTLKTDQSELEKYKTNLRERSSDELADLVILLNSTKEYYSSYSSSTTALISSLIALIALVTSFLNASLPILPPLFYFLLCVMLLVWIAENAKNRAKLQKCYIFTSLAEAELRSRT